MFFSAKESGVPLLNIHEFLLTSKPQLKQEGMFWF